MQIRDRVFAVTDTAVGDLAASERFLADDVLLESVLDEGDTIGLSEVQERDLSCCVITAGLAGYGNVVWADYLAGVLKDGPGLLGGETP